MTKTWEFLKIDMSHWGRPITSPHYSWPNNVTPDLTWTPCGHLTTNLRHFLNLFPTKQSGQKTFLPRDDLPVGTVWAGTTDQHALSSNNIALQAAR